MASMVSQNKYLGMTRSAITSQLYKQVNWREIRTSGIFLTEDNMTVLSESHENLDIVLDSAVGAKRLVDVLIHIADTCTYDMTVQMYALTRVEEILGLGMARSSQVGGGGAPDVASLLLSSSANESKSSNGNDKTSMGAPYGAQHMCLFLQPSTSSDRDSAAAGAEMSMQLKCHPFVRALSSPDPQLQKSAALSLAFMLANLPASSSLAQGSNAHSMDTLANWVVSKLKEAAIEGAPRSAMDAMNLVMPALGLLCQSMETRLHLLKWGCLSAVSQLLRRFGVTSNPQRLYEFTFALWTFSLVSDVARAGGGLGAAQSDDTTEGFRSANILTLLVDLLSAAPSRKIVRMVVSTLFNLARTADDELLTAIFNTNCLRHLDALVSAGKHKQVGDVEFENDVKGLLELLNTNHQELSTFERYAAELASGELSWGIVHTEKFWKENCRFMESNDWATLKQLIAFLAHPSEEVQCIALYDLGEFARFFPNGRIVVKSLGAKDVALELIGSSSEAVSRQALACASKIMVNSRGMVLS